MKVESKNSIKAGFTLSEQELRRLVDDMKQQMVKVSEKQTLIERYEIKFKNGAIAETESLDFVLSQENLGSSSIIRLKVIIQEKEDDPDNVITTEFIKLDEEGEVGPNGIKYSVLGNDRDWVFITLSELEERLGRVKKINISRFLRFEFLSPLFMLIFIGLLLSVAFKSISQTTQSLLPR